MTKRDRRICQRYRPRPSDAPRTHIAGHTEQIAAAAHDAMRSRVTVSASVSVTCSRKRGNASVGTEVPDLPLHDGQRPPSAVLQRHHGVPDPRPVARGKRVSRWQHESSRDSRTLQPVIAPVNPVEAANWLLPKV